MGGMFGALAGFVGAVGKGAGMLLRGLASGLAAFANPLVPLGALAIGAAIVAIGAGIAGAAWLTGKALPTFAKGLKSFEDLDGDKIYDAGVGIGALGAGLAVFGVGGAAAGIGGMIGGIAEGLTSFFGGKTPFEKVLDFQKHDFDKVKIKNNAEAMKAFSGAMAVTGGATALSGVGSAIGAIGGAIGKFFGGTSTMGPATYAKVTEFEKAGPFDTAKVKSNAEALVAYSTAMAKFSAIGAKGSLLGAVGAIGDSVTKFFGGSTGLPYAEIIKFQGFPFIEADIKRNANALVAYSTAMSSYKGTAAVGAMKGTVGAIAGSITNFFGGDKDAGVPFKKITEFSTFTFDQKKIESNANALVAYSNAMSKYAGIKAVGDMKNAVGSIGGAVTGLLGGKSAEDSIPYAKMTRFGAAVFNQKGIETNALALVAFGKAMSKYSAQKAAADLLNAGSSIGGAITGLLGGKSVEDSIPYAKMTTFGAAVFNQKGIESNAIALVAFGKAMADYAKTKPDTTWGQMAGALMDGVLGFFGAKKKGLPIDEIKAFAAHDLPVAGIKNSAEGLQVFAKAMGGIKVSGTTDFSDFKNQTESLAEALPYIQKLAFGGEIKRGVFHRNIKLGSGILDPKLKLDEVAYKVAQVRNVLMGGAMPKRADYATRLQEAQEASGAGALGAAGGNTNVNAPITTVGPTVNSSSSTSWRAPRAGAGNARPRPTGRLGRGMRGR